MSMKLFLVFIMLLTSLTLFSQVEKNQDTLLTLYISKLELNDIQTEEFTLIYNKYKTNIYRKDIDNNTFNKINKLRDIEIYNMLTEEQFSVYKKVKKEIEPQLKYRWN
jgi:lipopolysaccharide export LptBFGC system permease protein LptF